MGNRRKNSEDNITATKRIFVNHENGVLTQYLTITHSGNAEHQLGSFKRFFRARGVNLIDAVGTAAFVFVGAVSLPCSVMIAFMKRRRFTCYHHVVAE